MTTATSSCCGGASPAKLPGSVRWSAGSSEAANDILPGRGRRLRLSPRCFLSINCVGARTQQGGRKAESKEGIRACGNRQGTREGPSQTQPDGKGSGSSGGRSHPLQAALRGVHGDAGEGSRRALSLRASNFKMRNQERFLGS